MRMTGLCWSCSIALAAGFVRQSRASEEETTTIEKVVQTRKTWPIFEFRPQREQKIIGHRMRSIGISTKRSAETAFFPKITEAAVLVGRALGSSYWDKVPEGVQGRKRDATICPADFQLCPASLDGGCCPSDRICDTSSCLPNTATPASACGISSYIACGINAGGGCCPPQYLCPTDPTGGCTPSPGATVTQTCSTGLYACAASLGGGCCTSGFACAYNGCYATTPTTFTLTETLTTTDAIGNLGTVTTTITSSTVLNSPTSTPTTVGIIPKVSAVPTPIPKIAASSTAKSGLSTPEIGGIIGGAGFILIVILIAAFIIIRRLNRAIKVTEAASRSRTSNSSRPRPPPISSDIDNMSVDPLMMTPSEFSSSLRGLHTSTHEVDAPHVPQSPPAMHSPFGERGSPYYNGYGPVPTSDSNYSSSRNPSMDSTPPVGMVYNPNAGYFDIPPHGRRPSQHQRNWSDASSQSQWSPTPSTPVELDAGQDGSRSAFQRALLGLGMGRLLSRRRSEPAGLPSRQPKMKKTEPVVLTGGPVRPAKPVLGHIPEAGESSVQVDKGGTKKHVRETSETVLIDRGSTGFVVDNGLEYGTGVPEMRQTGWQ